MALRAPPVVSIHRFVPALTLCYHAISDSWEDRLAVTPATFERQMRMLRWRGYRPVNANEVTTERGRIFHVTFDDAFRNVASILGVLERLGVPATVFACPGFADHGRPLDVPELVTTSRLHFEEGKTMRWEDLRGLVDHGVEVGSHTLTHPHLTQMESRDLERELRESRERLEDELRRPCRFLAYPYGEENGRVRLAAKAAGYEAAFSLDGEDDATDRYAVPRIGIWRGDGLLRTTLKTLPRVRRGVRTVERLRHRS
jgi:peptidoglycan/xylan/chitin deacetylase (PgdA/CDA1 family)